MKPTVPVALIACLLATCLPPTASAQSIPKDSVTGLWAYVTSFPIGLAGELTLTRRGELREASIGGATAEAKASNGQIRLVFPHEDGTLRGPSVNSI